MYIIFSDFMIKRNLNLRFDNPEPCYVAQWGEKPAWQLAWKS